MPDNQNIPKGGITSNDTDFTFALVRGPDGTHYLRLDNFGFDRLSDRPMSQEHLAFVTEIGPNFSERDHRRVMALSRVAARLYR